MAEPRWQEGLKDAQRAAVTHDGGPLLVVAGAGTGKTRTLAARAARLVSEGAAADRILLLTFSRRAAREMLHWAERLGGRGRAPACGAAPSTPWRTAVAEVGLGGLVAQVAEDLCLHGATADRRPSIRPVVGASS